MSEHEYSAVYRPDLEPYPITILRWGEVDNSMSLEAARALRDSLTGAIEQGERA